MSSSRPRNETLHVLDVARLQQAMTCWTFGAIPLGYVAAVIAGVLDLEFDVPRFTAHLLVWGFIVVLNLIIASFAFRLARAIYGLPLALVTALFVMVPCWGLIAVLILNGSAIDYLRRKDVVVGFFGATKEQLVRLAEMKEDGGNDTTPPT
jgi:hypothetical protein